MRKIYTLPAVAIVAGAAIAFTHTAFSADHNDAPGTAATTGQSADIADVYTWMDPTGKDVILAMTIDGSSTKTSVFDPAVQYVFHTASNATFPLGGLGGSPVDVIATFDSTGTVISLWVATAGSTTTYSEFVTGDASKGTLKSADGKVQVFAGPRADSFFFNLDGYHNTQVLVDSVAGSLTFDAGGCPVIPAADQKAIISTLGHGADGGAPSNNFATKDEMAIVVQLDASLLNAGGAIMSVWGATYK